MKTIKFKVASVTEHKKNLQVVVKDKLVDALLVHTEVHLVSEDGRMGHTFQFNGPNTEPFEMGDTVSVQLSIDPKPAKSEKPSTDESRP